MSDVEQVSWENVQAASCRIRECDGNGPTQVEMLAAWKEFKETRLFAVLLAHLERADKLLACEGTIWGFFYNGYLAGHKAHRPMFLPRQEVLTSDEIKMLLEDPHGKETV